MSYSIYISKVVGVSNQGDDRVQVRILPQMSDTNSFPNSKCPLFPFFFRGEVYTANYGEYMWVICDDEFSSGYILGPANYNTTYDKPFTRYPNGSLEKATIVFSIPSELIKTLSSIKVDLQGFTLDTSNVKVTYWSKTCIHLVQRDTGAVCIAHDNGTIFLIMNDSIYMQTKTKNGDPEYNRLSVTENGISMSANHIKLESEDIRLGKDANKKVMTSLVNKESGQANVSPVASDYVWA